MSTAKKVNKPFLITSILLLFFGFLIFLSASLGLLASRPTSYSSILMNQIGFGLILGLLVAFVFSLIPYRFWSKVSLYIYIFSIILALLVFVPGIGMSSGGARRWIIIAGISFQPVELIKITYIIFISAWFNSIRKKIHEIKYGFLSYILISLPVVIVLFLQPDMDNLLLIVATGLVIYFLAGAPLKHLSILIVLGLIFSTIAYFSHGHVRDRISTFLSPGENSQTSGYQIQQSVIAIGSGDMFGKGFGQSLQKFKYLPEPIGDSIFAVASEEFGFVGSSALAILYFLFLFFGLKIAVNAKDLFGRLMVSGIVIIIVGQSYLNMLSMLGLFPLAGLPLLFVSHGGTALLITLSAVGIILNVSKFQNK